MNTLTQERLKEVLKYNRRTGNFRWRIAHRGVAVGDIAGFLNKTLGYWMIRIDGVLYYAHRLAWLYIHGHWPLREIDHVNGERADNPINNLRLATLQQNRHNSRRRKNNKCGYKWVVFHPASGKYRPCVRLDGRAHYSGLYDTALQAHQAACTLAKELHGDFARAA